jgi:hypothetical protein
MVGTAQVRLCPPYDSGLADRDPSPAQIGMIVLAFQFTASLLDFDSGRTSIEFVHQVCAYLPAIGLLAVFLPKLPRHAR